MANWDPSWLKQRAEILGRGNEKGRERGKGGGREESDKKGERGKGETLFRIWGSISVSIFWGERVRKEKRGTITTMTTANLLIQRIPQINHTVTPTSNKGPTNRVKSDSIHYKNDKKKKKGKERKGKRRKETWINGVDS